MHARKYWILDFELEFRILTEFQISILIINFDFKFRILILNFET